VLLQVLHHKWQHHTQQHTQGSSRTFKNLPHAQGTRLCVSSTLSRPAPASGCHIVSAEGWRLPACEGQPDTSAY
jgi:hypothetical protein